jgi:hypothetical protein
MQSDLISVGWQEKEVFVAAIPIQDTTSYIVSARKPLVFGFFS